MCCSCRNRFVYTSLYSKCKQTHWDYASFYVASMSWSIFERLIALALPEKTIIESLKNSLLFSAFSCALSSAICLVSALFFYLLSAFSLDFALQTALLPCSLLCSSFQINCVALFVMLSCSALLSFCSTHLPIFCSAVLLLVTLF